MRRLNPWELKMMTFRILHCPGTGCPPFHQPLNMALIPQDHINVAILEQEASISDFPLSLQHIHTFHITNTTLASPKRLSPCSGRWHREGPGTPMTQPAISPEAQSPFAMDPEKYSASKPGVSLRSFFLVFGILKRPFYLTGEPVGGLCKGEIPCPFLADQGTCIVIASLKWYILGMKDL